MTARFHTIDGYWKDDLSHFEGYIVTDADSEDSTALNGSGLTDDDVFFYGLSASDIERAYGATLAGQDTEYEFVITRYTLDN